MAFGQSRLKGHLTGPRPVGVEMATWKGEIEKTEVEWKRKEGWQRGITYKEGLHPVGPELACRVADGSGLEEQSCLFKSSRLSWSSQKNTYQTVESFIWFLSIVIHGSSFSVVSNCWKEVSCVFFYGF